MAASDEKKPISLYQTLRSLRRVPWLGTLKQNKAEKHRIVLMVYGLWQAYDVFRKVVSVSSNFPQTY